MMALSYHAQSARTCIAPSTGLVPLHSAAALSTTQPVPSARRLRRTQHLAKMTGMTRESVNTNQQMHAFAAAGLIALEQGQMRLLDRARSTCAFSDTENGRHFPLTPNTCEQATSRKKPPAAIGRIIIQHPARHG